MRMRDYQENARRTASEHESRDLAIAAYAMGLAGEVGEMVDLLKKHLFHGLPVNQNKLKSEAGDVLWYLANLCSKMGLDMDEVAEGNLVKLRQRYPNGFVKGGGIRGD